MSKTDTVLLICGMPENRPERKNDNRIIPYENKNFIWE